MVLLVVTADSNYLDYWPFGILWPILTQSGWKDRKGRFPIHYIFDGMCLDTFLIVRRIEHVVFRALSGGVLIRGSRAGESQLNTASCPARGFY